MKIWMFSNILLATWMFGNYFNLWHGGLSTGSMCVMYSIYVISNFDGLRKYGKKTI